MNRKPLYRQLYFWVLMGMLAGVLVGCLLPVSRPFQFSLFGSSYNLDGTDFKPLSDGFIRLIRMMIAPIIFTTVVTGIAGMGSLKRLGRIGLKALLYFEVLTTLALVIGWVVATAFQPGAGMNVDVASLNTADLKETFSKAKEHHSFADFLLHIIPNTISGAFAEGDVLQVLFISVLFGVAMTGMGESSQRLILALEQVSKVLMRMIAMIMQLAPVAVFAAMSFTIAKFGPHSLQPLGKMMACMYLTCLCFVLVCLGFLLKLNGLNIFKFLKYVRDELLIVFGTASSESVLPRMMTKLERLGCSKSVVGMVLPAGYTFNLDGSSIYLTIGAMFIAQATNTHLSFGQKLAVLTVCLVTSKGAAAVAGGGFITLAATLATMKTIPVEGMVLILGVDWFMAQARALTNMAGNGVATVVISNWENEFDAAQARQVLESKADAAKELEAVEVPVERPSVERESVSSDL